MKKPIVTTLFAAVIFSSAAHAAEPKIADEMKWPMFRQKDVVTLAGRNIPPDYLRKTITDSQNRAVAGEWLVIDRKAKIVKFRRADGGKEFVIPFANLSEPDRRYAELENGYTWKTDVPIIIPPEHRPDTIELEKLERKKAEWLRIDREARVVHIREEEDGEGSYNFDSLSKEDLRFAEDKSNPSALPAGTRTTIATYNLPGGHVGKWISVDQSNKLVIVEDELGKKLGRSFDQLTEKELRYAEDDTLGDNWPSPKFDPAKIEVAKDYKTGKVISEIPVIRTAWAYMSSMPTQDIYDHIRVRTLTSDFLYKYNDYRRTSKKAIEGKLSPDPIYNIKPLDQIMKAHLKVEPAKERVTLKDAMTKSGINLLAKQMPTASLWTNTNGKTGIDIKAIIPPYYIAACYLTSSSKKKDITIENILVNIKQNKAFMYRDASAEIEKEISKQFGLNSWRPQIFYDYTINRNDELLKDLDKMILAKSIRQSLRNGKPVIAKQTNGGSVLLIGFTKEIDKEVSYDAIVIKNDQPSLEVLPETVIDIECPTLFE